MSYGEQREDSIEYHKAEYLAARDGRPLVNEVRSLWGKVTGRYVQHRIQGLKLRRHEQALIRFGYLRERTVIVSNKPALGAWEIAEKKGAHLRLPRLSKEIGVFAAIGTNTIVLRAVPDRIPIWERLIREADVPENK